MKTQVLVAALAALGNAAPAMLDSEINWAELFDSTPSTSKLVKADLHEALKLPPTVQFRNFESSGIRKSVLVGGSAEVNTTNMCGAFQEKANGSTAAYSTAAATFIVPKLSRRGSSTETQLISTFVGIDGIHCAGLEVGVISAIYQTGSDQRNMPYVRFGNEAPYSADLAVENGDNMAAAMSIHDDGTLSVLIMNRNSGERFRQSLLLDEAQPCMSSVSWTMEDYVAAAGATPVGKEHFPMWDVVKFGYMDANMTDGTSLHLAGSTFTTMVTSAKAMCRGVSGASEANQLLISSII